MIKKVVDVTVHIHDDGRKGSRLHQSLTDLVELLQSNIDVSRPVEMFTPPTNPTDPYTKIIKYRQLYSDSTARRKANAEKRKIWALMSHQRRMRR